jgi:cytochrome c peroxidase
MHSCVIVLLGLAAAQSEASTVRALSETLLPSVPKGFDSLPAAPADNPITEAKIRLGKRLFSDPILSTDGKVACATCHQPDHGFANTARVATGVAGRQGRRNVPSLLNRGYGRYFFWDGRATTLEDQAIGPMTSPLELGSSMEAIVKRLQARDDYRLAFHEAFAGDITKDKLVRALATYERSLLLGNSRVDRFRAGVVDAINERERHGLWLYESRGGCWRCHSGPNFTDEDFHNTGIGWNAELADRGRYEITNKETDRGRFKTPSLRGLTRTAPYMHDGSLTSLEDVVAFYTRGGNANPNLDPTIKPLELSEQDRQDLVAFLKALSP